MNEERTGKCLRQVEHICVHSTRIFHSGQPSHGGDRKTVLLVLVHWQNNTFLISKLQKVLFVLNIRMFVYI